MTNFLIPFNRCWRAFKSRRNTSCLICSRSSAIIANRTFSGCAKYPLRWMTGSMMIFTSSDKQRGKWTVMLGTVFAAWLNFYWEPNWCIHNKFVNVLRLECCLHIIFIKTNHALYRHILVYHAIQLGYTKALHTIHMANRTCYSFTC